jgi:hypothetical protein
MASERTGETGEATTRYWLTDHCRGSNGAYLDDLGYWLTQARL